MKFFGSIRDPSAWIASLRFESSGSAQESYGGRAVRCGACWIRCSTSSLLNALPQTSCTTTYPWKALADKMMEARLYLAEVMTTTSERELLESMDKKEFK